MSQTEEFVKVVEAAKEAKGVIFVTGKPKTRNGIM